jgi:hypothetical protein
MKNLIIFAFHQSYQCHQISDDEMEGHAARKADMINTDILVGKSEGNCSLGRSGPRWRIILILFSKLQGVRM